MERLTYRKDGKAVNCGCHDWCATCTGAECLEVQRMVDRLAAYEDAEEQGLLVRLPCKVGDTVWVIITSYVYGEIGDPPEPRYRIESRPFELSMLESFGKTVFLTRKEIEAALKKEG